MTLTATNPRIGSDVIIGMAKQAAAGSPAAPTVYFNAKKMGDAPNNVDLEYRGTQQTLFKRREPVRRVAYDHEETLEAFINHNSIRLLMENALSGAPFCSLALSGAMSIGGSAAANLSGLCLYHPSGNHNASNIIYGSLDQQTSQIIVKLYKNASMTSQVASGVVASSLGSTTLAERNSSGMSGTVIVTSGAVDTASLVIYTAYARMQTSTKFNNYLSFRMYDGYTVQAMQDCVVQKITLKSGDGEALEAEITIKGGETSLTETSMTGTFDTDSYFAHNGDLTLYRSSSLPGGLHDTELAAETLEFELENTVRSFRGNNEAPFAQIKQTTRAMGKFTAPYTDEVDSIVDKIFRTPSQGISWDAMKFQWLAANATTQFLRLMLGNVNYNFDKREISGEDEQPDLEVSYETYHNSDRDALTVDISL